MTHEGHSDKVETEGAGESVSFDTLFQGIQAALRSYLFRITANVHDCDDMVQDVYIKAREGMAGFQGRSSFKTWVFAIATNHARRAMQRQARWQVDTHRLMRELAHDVPDLMQELEDTNRLSPHGVYEIKEHIDFCLTCVSKMLRLEEQLVVILKEIYGFKLREIAVILDFSESKVKHALQNARRRMMSIFDHTCALVSKNGICNQCSELNGKFNPKQEARKKVMELRIASAADSESREELLNLRLELCRGVDHFHTDGRELHDVFFKLCHMANQAV